MQARISGGLGWATTQVYPARERELAVELPRSSKALPLYTFVM